MVRHIYANLTSHFRAKVPAKTFIKILKLTIDVYAVSRFFAGEPHSAIERQLRFVTIQDDLLKALELDDRLFDSQTTVELDRKLGIDTSEEAERFVREAEILGRFPAALGFCLQERNTILELAKALTSGGRRVMSWHASFPLGASFLAGYIGSADRISQNYREIYVVRPHASGTVPFDQELKLLSRRLDVEGSMKNLLDALVARSALLILLNAEAISTLAPTSRARKLIALAKASKGPAKKASILTVGPCTFRELNDPADVELTARLEQLLAIEPGSRWAFFLDQWRRFGTLRGNPRGEEVGSVLKRAQWHYQEVKDRPVWPINIRIRAYFASNLKNQAVFDPTAGFLTLAGQNASDIPEDIVSFEVDVRSFMKNWSQGYAPARLRLLRLISTAKYWLSDRMLERLQLGNDVDGELGAEAVESQMAELQFAAKKVPAPTSSMDGTQSHDRTRPAIQAPAASVTTPPNRKAKPERKPPEFTYVAGIGIKAIVQDDWRVSEPYTRAIAHYHIASSLFASRTDESALTGEFPFDPHWAGPDTYFVSETIRHLVRTIEAVNSRRVSKPLADFAGAFPDPPVARLKGCNPTQVMDFAFDVLYRQLLNEDKDKPDARALSKRLGAYALAVEMLQLLSEPGKMGQPHWALSPRFHRTFIRECGYALLNVGDVEGALECFERLLGTGSGSSSADLHLDYVSDNLDLCLLLAARDDLKRAARHLDSAARRLPRAKKATIAIPDLATRKPTNVRLEKLTRRIESRRANLAYLNGDHDEALKILRDAGGADGISDPEMILTRISALTLSRQKNDHDEAMAACLSALLRQSSDGLQHEALGYRIALAGLLRSELRLLPAEKVLDTAHEDVLRNGCSERTFLNFLLEAGRVLGAQGRYPRAYASYLRACALRAHSRGFIREMREATTLALEALQRTRERMAELGAEGWSAEIQRLKAEDKQYNDKDSPRTLGAFARDPLYGYSIAEARPTYEDLSTESGVLNHIAQMQDLVRPRTRRAMRTA